MKFLLIVIYVVQMPMSQASLAWTNIQTTDPRGIYF